MNPVDDARRQLNAAALAVLEEYDLRLGDDPERKAKVDAYRQELIAWRNENMARIERIAAEPTAPSWTIQ